MQRLEVSGAVRPLQGPLGVKGLIVIYSIIRHIEFSWIIFYTPTEILKLVDFSIVR